MPKHYEVRRVGQEWCLARVSDGRAVAWSPAPKGSRKPSPEFQSYADEAEKAAQGS